MNKKFVVGLAAIPVAVAAYRLLKRSAPVSETEATELEADAAADEALVEAAPAPIEIAVADFPVAEPAPAVVEAPNEIAVADFQVAEAAPAKAHHSKKEPVEDAIDAAPVAPVAEPVAAAAKAPSHPKKKRARKRPHRAGARPRHG